jgi:hypothetical protein
VDGLQEAVEEEVIKILELRRHLHLMRALVVEEKVLKDQHHLELLELTLQVEVVEVALGMVRN